MSAENIIIAAIKSWNLRNAEVLKKQLDGSYQIHIIHRKEDLNNTWLQNLNPSYIFFPHWSWKIPEAIYEKYECVVFHMTDLPFGRGGSPLQNLIRQKIYRTKISAIKAGQETDGGDIYLKRNFYVGLGSAEELYMSASDIIFFDMIPYILNHRPIPVPQQGTPVYFTRRKPEESDMFNQHFETLQDIYDFIRMVDAEGYPRAYIQLGQFKIIFSGIQKKSGLLTGKFEITENSSQS